MTQAEAVDRAVRHLMAISCELYEGPLRVRSRAIAAMLSDLADVLRHARRYEATEDGYRCVDDVPLCTCEEIPY